MVGNCKNLHLAESAGRRNRSILALLCGLLLSEASLALEPCSPAVGHVVEGRVEVSRSGAPFDMAPLDAALCSGDTVRAGHGRAALRLGLATTIRLDESTVLTLVIPGAGDRSVLDVRSGKVHVITRTPRPFNVRTPFVNANVEGTEFTVRVDASSASVSVTEGIVSASNEFGAERLVGGESATAVRGAAPRKNIRVAAEDAVVWALHVPYVMDPALDGMSLAGDPAFRTSLEAYRAGRLDAALDALATRSPTDDERPFWCTALRC